MNRIRDPFKVIDVRLGRTLRAAAFALAAFMAFPTGACRQTLPQPAEIHPEDMCAQCRMAISERRYASEFVTSDDSAYKFDDIACMLEGIRKRQGRGDITAIFAVDYQTRKWIKAQDALFVRSQSLKTPMGGGIVAFQEKSRAEAAAQQSHGELLRFSDLNQ